MDEELLADFFMIFLLGILSYLGWELIFDCFLVFRLEKP